MRFGRNFYDHQVPEWSDAYIDYDALKHLVKSASRQQNALDEVLPTLHRYSEELDASVTLQHTLIKQRLDAVLAHFHVQSFSTPTPNLTHVSQVHLHNLVKSLEDVGSSIAKLELFSKLNRDALRRIAAKLNQPRRRDEDTKGTSNIPSSADQSFHRDIWTDDLLLVNRLLRSASREQHLQVQPEYPEPFKTDFRGRNSLHYAAESGSPETVRSILNRAKAQDATLSTLITRDAAGTTPLHIAIRRGDIEVVRLLVDASSNGEDKTEESVSEETSGALLALAIRMGHPEAAKVLIDSGKGIKFQGKHAETPLYIAARVGQVDTVKALIAAHDAAIDTEDSSRGRTPLIAACVEGHLEVVDVLLQAGARPEKLDLRGWSAIDHAAYRGYPKLVEALQNNAGPDSSVKVQDATVSHDTGSTIRPTVSAGTADTMNATLQREPDKCHIYVNLGSFNLYEKVKAISLEPYLTSIAPEIVPETSLWLDVSATGCSKQSYLHRLPILEDLTNDPWHFTTDNPENAMLTFKIYSVLKGDSQGNALIGTGVALLGPLKEGLRPERESLVRDHRIPMVGSDGNYMGAITFTFVVSRVLTLARGPPTPPQSMRPMPRTQVVGHRGLGQNDKRQQHLQIGENTIESFKRAVDLGAAFIEFDVQVTKDYVPVIYHDFLVSEAGTDATMHTLSYRQFMSLSDAQSGTQQSHANERLPWDERARPSVPRLKRTRSLCAPADCATVALFDRMQHTFEFAASGMKPNTRGHLIHEPFVTLRELFEKLPESISFDMELKYPMLYEADDWKMDTFAMELNKFLDALLDVVYEFAGNRSLFFTSFSPELCMILATKQRTYPVLFLNDSSNWPTGDSRALSTQTAVHFARKWGLQGVVMASEPFVAAPKLIKHVREAGLFCSSYGALNDEVEKAKIQARANLDAIIVNNVPLISKALAGGYD